VKPTTASAMLFFWLYTRAIQPTPSRYFTI